MRFADWQIMGDTDLDEEEEKEKEEVKKRYSMKRLSSPTGSPLVPPYCSSPLPYPSWGVLSD
jgi:hypothetical protein